MDDLTGFFTSMIALSVGVERVVEMIKGIVPPLRADPDPATDKDGSKAARRRVVLQALAAMVGALAAYFIGCHRFLPKLLPEDLPFGPHVLGSAVLGLMSSGGSAFWNHLLDIVGAIKTTREKIAKAPVSP